MSSSFEALTDAQRGGAGAKPGGGAERREAVRRPLRSPAMVLLPGQPGRLGRTIDVSETGICVSLADSLPAGTDCLVGFELPDKAGNRKRMQSKAKVVHSVLGSQSDGFKVGMRLTAPPDELVRALQAFVRE
ncbi:PilZ domain-containing protein [Aquabacterium sp.]|uniref:PilZ domain-containing protein n=1 Tax=Aquabacterium sp. TaxID=1872578 RepID=UPI003783A07C